MSQFFSLSDQTIVLMSGMKTRRCAPNLSGEAAEMLSSHFVSLRKEVAQVERDNDERSSIPMTVR